jgi:taurine dioxygenase
MEVRRVADTFVGEVAGVDLSRPMSTAEFAPILDAFHGNSVLLFRGQSLGKAPLVDFSRRFGELLIQVLAQYLASDQPEAMRLSNTDEAGKRVVFRNELKGN